MIEPVSVILASTKAASNGYKLLQSIKPERNIAVGDANLWISNELIFKHIDILPNKIRRRLNRAKERAENVRQEYMDIKNKSNPWSFVIKIHLSRKFKRKCAYVREEVESSTGLAVRDAIEKYDQENADTEATNKGTSALNSHEGQSAQSSSTPLRGYHVRLKLSDPQDRPTQIDVSCGGIDLHVCNGQCSCTSGYQATDPMIAAQGVSQTFNNRTGKAPDTSVLSSSDVESILSKLHSSPLLSRDEGYIVKERSSIITQSTLAEDDTRTETIPMDGEDTEAGTDWDGDSDYQSAYSIELYSVHSEGGPPAERLEHLVMHTGGLF
ncbi:hypothetical protein PHLCEN_2v5986, partial [Hermanssonia centrifuga]